jgi:hypothetical protein
MNKILNCLISLFIIILISGCSASRNFKPVKINVNGDYVHKFTNTSFPVEWKAFSRESLTAYDKDTTNLGVNYISNIANQNIKFTVYVYPAPLALEIRLRDEYFKWMNETGYSLNQEYELINKHIIVSKNGYKVIGLVSAFSTEKNYILLVLFECGKYFLRFNISAKLSDADKINDLSNKIIDKFSPVDIVKKQALIPKATIHIAPAIVRDTSCLHAIFAAVHAKSKWVYENVDSLERCFGYPSLYFEEQKITIDSMLNEWARRKHTRSKIDNYFSELKSIRDKGFLNEFIYDQYFGTLIIPGYIKLDMEKYKLWKIRFNPSVELRREHFYLIGYEESYEKDE